MMEPLERTTWCETTLSRVRPQLRAVKPNLPSRRGSCQTVFRTGHESEESSPSKKRMPSNADVRTAKLRQACPRREVPESGRTRSHEEALLKSQWSVRPILDSIRCPEIRCLRSRSMRRRPLPVDCPPRSSLQKCSGRLRRRSDGTSRRSDVQRRHRGRRRCSYVPHRER